MSANNNSSTDYADDPSELAAQAYTQISCFMAWSTMTSCMVGIFSNVLSMIVFSLPLMRQTPINLLLFGMSAIDLVLCVLALFVFVVPEFYGCYRSSFALLLSSYSFVYIYPLTSAAQTASIWLFLVVSYERWNAVCGNSGRVYRRASNVVGSNGIGGSAGGLGSRARRHAIAAVLMVVFCSLAYNFIRFFEYRVISVYDEKKDVTLMSVDNVLKSPEQNPFYSIYMYAYYVGLFLLTHFAGPFFALLLVNGMILRTIYIARRRRRTLLTKKEKKEHRTSLMMAIVISMFLLCHAPPFVLNVIESFDSSWFYGEDVVLAYALNDITNLLIVANAAATALIYYHFNRSYHDVCNRLFVEWICPWAKRWTHVNSEGGYYDESKNMENAAVSML